MYNGSLKNIFAEKLMKRFLILFQDSVVKTQKKKFDHTSSFCLKKSNDRPETSKVSKFLFNKKFFNTYLKVY